MRSRRERLAETEDLVAAEVPGGKDLAEAVVREVVAVAVVEAEERLAAGEGGDSCGSR